MSVNIYKLEFEDRGDYLYAHLTGVDSFAASLSYWNEIADQTKALGLNRVLVHEALKGEVSADEVFDVIMDILPSGLGVRVAFYDENEENAEINELGELIANNRGVIIRVFQTLKDAEKWIVSND